MNFFSESQMKLYTIMLIRLTRSINDMADFEVAKKMFYSCYGSYQSIDREYGNLYYAYHV